MRKKIACRILAGTLALSMALTGNFVDFSSGLNTEKTVMAATETSVVNDDYEYDATIDAFDFSKATDMEMLAYINEINDAIYEAGEIIDGAYLSMYPKDSSKKIPASKKMELFLWAVPTYAEYKEANYVEVLKRLKEVLNADNTVVMNGATDPETDKELKGFNYIYESLVEYDYCRFVEIRYADTKSGILGEDSLISNALKDIVDECNEDKDYAKDVYDSCSLENTMDQLNSAIKEIGNSKDDVDENTFIAAELISAFSKDYSKENADDIKAIENSVDGDAATIAKYLDGVNNLIKKKNQVLKDDYKEQDGDVNDEGKPYDELTKEEMIDAAQDAASKVSSVTVPEVSDGATKDEIAEAFDEAKKALEAAEAAKAVSDRIADVINPYNDELKDAVDKSKADADAAYDKVKEAYDKVKEAYLAELEKALEDAGFPTADDIAAIEDAISNLDENSTTEDMQKLIDELKKMIEDAKSAKDALDAISKEAADAGLGDELKDRVGSLDVDTVVGKLTDELDSLNKKLQEIYDELAKKAAEAAETAKKAADAAAAAEDAYNNAKTDAEKQAALDAAEAARKAVEEAAQQIAEIQKKMSEMLTNDSFADVKINDASTDSFNKAASDVSDNLSKVVTQVTEIFKAASESAVSASTSSSVTNITNVTTAAAATASAATASSTNKTIKFKKKVVKVKIKKGKKKKVALKYVAEDTTKKTTDSLKVKVKKKKVVKKVSAKKKKNKVVLKLKGKKKGKSDVIVKLGSAKVKVKVTVK